LTGNRSVSAADEAAPVSAAEAKTLFDGLQSVPALVIAVSGGPDSTALLVLAARWRAALKNGPALIAVTVDHGLRPESAREARAVKRLASRLGVRHRTLRWTGRKPATGLPEQARHVRYRLLAAAARGAGAHHVLTAHTLDDQAETVLLRMARGSGLTGLGAMARATRLDARVDSPLAVRSPARRTGGKRRTATAEEDIFLVRPLLDLPKARLIATLAAIGMSFADDPSNRDPRFTRPRLRALLPTLASEGLDARRFAQLARRLRRADAALEFAVDAAAAAVSDGSWADRGPIVFDAERFVRLPAEVALRLLGRAIAQAGDEGPVQLGKLEALHQALEGAGPAASRFRRTLAGALMTLSGGRLTVERAPPRSRPSRLGRKTLTTRQHGAAGRLGRR
jgi:tRNA(Ile)-lysidine synthase